MVFCSAPACNHSHKNCSLFRFPSDIARRKVWIKNCGRSFATTTHRLCKHHFKKHLLQRKGSRQALARNAIPTIFETNSRKKSKDFPKIKMRSEKVRSEQILAKASNLVSQVKISNCWSEKQKQNARKELLSAIYEDSNPLEDDVTELEKQNTNNQSLGLENIPMIGNDISSESNIEFSFSIPKKLNDLTPILAKWSPKINDDVSIIEDLIDSSDDDDDENRSDEETSSNHVIYIDEDSVKREEFVDENSDESFECESVKNSRKGKEELNYSFDENKVKKEFHITDNLRVKLPKLNITGKTINISESNLTSQSKTREISSKETTTSSSTRKKKLPNKSIFSNSNKSSKNRKISQSNQRRKACQSNSKSKRLTSVEPKSQNKSINNHTNDKRQSLRLSGKTKSPEIKLLKYVPSLTRSGKIRIYEEPKCKSTNVPTIDDEEVSCTSSKIEIKEPINDDIARSRSPSPSAYRKNIEVFFVCQCCDEKYESVEEVKTHIKTHFPNCATN